MPRCLLQTSLLRLLKRGLSKPCMGCGTAVKNVIGLCLGCGCKAAGLKRLRDDSIFQDECRRQAVFQYHIKIK